MSSQPGEGSGALSEDFYAARLANQAGLRQWYQQERARRTVEALEKNGYTAMFVEQPQEAREEILRLVPRGAAIGAGGSLTIRQIGVLQELSRLGHRLYDHWVPGLSFEDMVAVRRAQLTCDVFLTSANAITLDGQIVCTDGVGNRVSALTFGPGKVIIAAGVNKITRDLESALRRVKDVAAPMTLKETGLSLPCTETGVCLDCKSPQRGCRVTLILERKPALTDTTVILIGESLGF